MMEGTKKEMQETRKKDKEKGGQNIMKEGGSKDVCFYEIIRQKDKWIKYLDNRTGNKSGMLHYWQEATDSFYYLN